LGTRDPREADRFLRTGQNRNSRHPASHRYDHPHCLHRLAETGAGRVKTLQGADGEKRLRVGDYRVRFTEEIGAAKEGKQSEGTLHIHAVRDRKDAYR
jgi:hypothetical protein